MITYKYCTEVVCHRRWCRALDEQLWEFFNRQLSMWCKHVRLWTCMRDRTVILLFNQTRSNNKRNQIFFYCHLEFIELTWIVLLLLLFEYRTWMCHLRRFVNHICTFLIPKYSFSILLNGFSCENDEWEIVKIPSVFFSHFFKAQLFGKMDNYSE